MFIILRGDGYVDSFGGTTQNIKEAAQFADAQSAYRMALETDRVDLLKNHD